MDEVKVFEGKPVRMMGTEVAPQWVAKDVCEILGIGNPSMALAEFGEDEKDTINFTDSVGRPHSLLVVTEPGLYRLIFRSNKPEAERFKRWVFHEVLPAIRKSGQYSLAANVDPHLALLDSLRERYLAEKRLEAAQQQLRLDVARVDRTALVANDTAELALGFANAALETQENNTGHYGVIGFANLIGQKLTTAQASKIGGELSRQCKKDGRPLPKMNSEVFGKINLYPVDILEKHFNRKLPALVSK